jgi:hypothetical protein
VCERGLSLTGTCVVPPKPGDTCVIDDFQCGSGFSYCGATSSCRALAKFGEPCTNLDGEGTYCMVGTCDETLAAPTCRPAAPGEGCTVQADCAPGSLCQSAFVGGTFVTQCSPACF